MKKTIVLICCIITSSLFIGCGSSEKENSSSSLNLCEVKECSEDGTNEIIGISGKTEYYCDEHYKAMAEQTFSNNANDISGSDSEIQEGVREIESDIEEQESINTETGNDAISGSISRGIVSFVSATSKNGYALKNPTKREDGNSSLVTCEVENSNDEFYVQYLVEDGDIQGIWINAMSEEAVYNDNYKNCIIAMAISFNENAEIESVMKSVDNALNNSGEVIMENEMVFQFENEEFIIMSN
jgi:hypothetical protein